MLLTFEQLSKYFDNIKKTRNGFLVCCPFHDDTRPSLFINFQGYFNCFACHQTGYISKILKKIGITDTIFNKQKEYDRKLIENKQKKQEIIEINSDIL